MCAQKKALDTMMSSEACINLIGLMTGLGRACGSHLLQRLQFAAANRCSQLTMDLNSTVQAMQFTMRTSKLVPTH